MEVGDNQRAEICAAVDTKFAIELTVGGRDRGACGATQHSNRRPGFVTQREQCQLGFTEAHGVSYAQLLMERGCVRLCNQGCRWGKRHVHRKKCRCLSRRCGGNNGYED